MAQFAVEELEGQEGRDPVRRQAGLLGRPRRVLPQDVHRARRRDRRRRALHERRHRVPRAAHHDQRREARRDLRARLLHRGRPDRAAGARARHRRAAARRRRLGLGEDARDRRRRRSRAATSRTTTRPTPTARRSRTFVARYKEKYDETPDAMAALGYDAAGILADALKRAGDTDGREAARRDRRDAGLRGRHRQDHASIQRATRARPRWCSRSRAASSSSTARCRRASPARARLGAVPPAAPQRDRLGQHLRPDRARLHDGVRRAQADQLRPRRGVHGRRDGGLLRRARARLRGASRRSRGCSRCSCSRWPRAALLGALIERVAYRPLRNAPRLASLITAIGISLLLQNGGQLAVRRRSEVLPVARRRARGVARRQRSRSRTSS